MRKIIEMIILSEKKNGLFIEKEQSGEPFCIDCEDISINI